MDQPKAMDILGTELAVARKLHELLLMTEGGASWQVVAVGIRGTHPDTEAYGVLRTHRGTYVGSRWRIWERKLIDPSDPAVEISQDLIELGDTLGEDTTGLVPDEQGIFWPPEG